MLPYYIFFLPDLFSIHYSLFTNSAYAPILNDLVGRTRQRLAVGVAQTRATTANNKRWRITQNHHASHHTSSAHLSVLCALCVPSPSHFQPSCQHCGKNAAARNKLFHASLLKELGGPYTQALGSCPYCFEDFAMNKATTSGSVLSLQPPREPPRTLRSWRLCVPFSHA